MSNYALYLIGYVVLIAGLAYGAHLLGVPQVWVVVGAVVLLGLGIIRGVTRTRRRELPPDAASVERHTVVERR
jgi:NADH:ubiquinone oxidoreductase subunit 6 (subunit J)